MVSRARKGVVSEWWWTVDRTILAAALALLFVGVVGSIGTSSAVAVKIGVSPYHFTTKHLLFLALAVPVVIGVSMLSNLWARRLAMVALLGAILALILTLFVAGEVKGAKRWIPLGFFTLQPSEFVKPALVVACAWFFAREWFGRVPGAAIATVIAVTVAGLLVLQPDIGQTTLVLGAWGTLFFLSGVPMTWLGVLGGIFTSAAAAAYVTIPHVASRVDRFLTGSGDNFQVERSIEAVLRGGWLGQGPGEGRVRKILPDSHTDFVFAAMTEEFGILAGIGLVAIFALIGWRALVHAANEEDTFRRLAVTGLAVVFVAQAFVNIGVSLRLLPTTGMTLPLVSYGGSSMIGCAFTIGLLLAFTRRNRSERARRTVQVTQLDRSAFVRA